MKRGFQTGNLDAIIPFSQLNAHASLPTAQLRRDTFLPRFDGLARQITLGEKDSSYSE